MAKRPLVTLTTDFGLTDPYVAAMKGTILRHCPSADIVDISHEVPPHDIFSGAFLLANAAPCFPEGTVHVAVVDPGVGTDRSILAGLFGGSVYVFPDNGVITFIKEMLPLQGLISVRNMNFLPQTPVSPTFHGRDIFGPLVGHILKGNPISRLGPTPAKYKLLEIPCPQPRGEELVGRAIYIDHFGNVISGISRAHLQERWKDLDDLHVYCQGRHVGPILATYGLVETGRPLAIFNSMDLLELAVNQGRFCDVFNAPLGAEISVRRQKFIEA
jgi:S-adenosylmethionine hydrolase